MEVYELMDDPASCGEQIANYVKGAGAAEAKHKRVGGEKGFTDFVKIAIHRKHGKASGGRAPTLGIIGRLGGIGARPERIGFVSDGDGALAAVSAAAKLASMSKKGDRLNGDVIITTHICPNAPTRPHDPAPFMDSPIDMEMMNAEEVDPAMDAILSINTTKGNRALNDRGFAITPTVKDGYILRVSEDLLEIMQSVTGRSPRALAITTQDITPYGNGIYHLNSILQPSVATGAPTVGVAITAESIVPGCATGATQLADVESTARFSIETDKAFTQNRCDFYDEKEFALLLRRYGSMKHLQTAGVRL